MNGSYTPVVHIGMWEERSGFSASRQMHLLERRVPLRHKMGYNSDARSSKFL